jgi:hypothetical protein
MMRGLWYYRDDYAKALELAKGMGTNTIIVKAAYHPDYPACVMPPRYIEGTNQRVKAAHDAGLLFCAEAYIVPKWAAMGGQLLKQAMGDGANSVMLNAEAEWESTDQQPALAFLETFNKAGPLHLCSDIRGGRLSDAYHQVFWKHIAGAHPMCFPGNVRVLTDNLTWVPIGDLAVGDGVLAVDECAAPGTYRHWQRAQVTHTFERRAEVWEFALDDGTLLHTTPNHPFLNTPWGHGNPWRPIGISTRLAQLIHPWEVGRNYDSGWLGGVLDGEGCVSRTAGDRRSTELFISQLPGAVLDRIMRVLSEQGVPFTRHQREDCTDQLTILGGWSGIMTALGRFQPIRLVQKMVGFIDKSPPAVRAQHRHIVGAQVIGVQDVFNLETTAGTFIAEGFPVHNCYHRAFRSGNPFGALQLAFDDTLGRLQQTLMPKVVPIYPVIQGYDGCDYQETLGAVILAHLYGCPGSSVYVSHDLNKRAELGVRDGWKIVEQLSSSLPASMRAAGGAAYTLAKCAGEDITAVINKLGIFLT